MLLCAPQPGLAAGGKLGAALNTSRWGCQELWGCAADLAAGMELPLRRDVPDVLLLAECWCVCTFICKGDVCGGCVLPYVKLQSPRVQLNEEASRRAEVSFALLKLLILVLLAILCWLFIAGILLPLTLRIGAWLGPLDASVLQIINIVKPLFSLLLSVVIWRS